MPQRDLRGRDFGSLRVLREDGRASNGGVRWRCWCVCGRKTTVASSDLQRWKPNQILSCGCLKKKAGSKNKIHGLVNLKEYSIWVAMRERCNNPRSANYPRYGGRGISVCPRWNSFELFLKDMGPRPPGRSDTRSLFSIERLDNNKDYCPENCTWVTSQQQARNRRVSRRISFNGESLCLAEWAARLGLSSSALSARLKRWGTKRALTEARHHEFDQRL